MLLEIHTDKAKPGQREQLIELFESVVVQASGLNVIGQFRSLDDEDTFVWIRTVDDKVEHIGQNYLLFFGRRWTPSCPNRSGSCSTAGTSCSYSQRKGSDAQVVEESVHLEAEGFVVPVRGDPGRRLSSLSAHPDTSKDRPDDPVGQHQQGADEAAGCGASASTAWSAARPRGLLRSIRWKEVNLSCRTDPVGTR